jgi:hypothetical protein
MKTVGDIASAAVQPPQWDPADVSGSLVKLYEYVEAHATRAIDWYYRSKWKKAKLSYVLRFLTIACAAIGGLIPIASSALIAEQNQRLQFNQWGYVAIGLAAFWLAWDRFAGSSTGWMRYISTGMVLETLQAEFRLDWISLMAEIGGGPPTSTQTAAALERLKAFTLAVRAQVEKETTAWVTEFQANLAQLEKQTQQALDQAREDARRQADLIDSIRKSAIDSQRNGAIDLSVETKLTLDAGFEVEIDGKLCRSGITGKTCGIADVAPGIHEVVVKAMASGKAVQVSKIVQVEGNKICPVAVSL